ncbi:hypothetical protein, partial [Escherichia coli]
GKTSIFSHPVYLFLRKFSLQDSRGGSPSDAILFQEGVSVKLRLPHNASSEIGCVMWSTEAMTIDILFQSTCD